MADVTLSTPLVDVVLDDGRTLTVRVLNADLIRWDRTAAKHGWGAFQTQPFVWLTFVSWSALRREGQIPQDWTWEEFSEKHCLQVKNTEGSSENGLATVDPTLVALVPE